MTPANLLLAKSNAESPAFGSRPSSPATTRPYTHQNSPPSEISLMTYSTPPTPPTMDSESMQEFVHKHFHEILQPFAAQIENINTLVDQLGAQSVKVASQVDAMSTQVNSVFDRTKALQNDLDSVKNRQKEDEELMQQGLQDMRDTRSKFAVEMKKQLAQMEDMDKRQSKTASLIGEEMRKCTAALGKFESDFADFKQFDIKYKRENIQAQLYSLEQARQATTEALRVSEERRLADHVDLKTLMEASHGRWQQDAESTQALKSAVSKLKIGLESAEEKINGLGTDSIKSAIKTLSTLQNQVDETTTGQALLKARWKESAVDMQNVKESIKEIRHVLGVPQEAHHKSHQGTKLVDTVMQMKDLLNNTVARTLENFDKANELSRELREKSQRLAEVEQLEPRLHAETAERMKNHTQKLQQWVGKMLKDMEVTMDAKDSSQRISRVEAAMQEDKLELLARCERLEKVQSQASQQLHDRIEGTSSRLQELDAAVAGTTGEVAVLRAGAETTRQYWDGLTKGVEKVHQNVTMDGTMLGVKIRKLPALSTVADS
eukprot:TRINITY_DN72719_c0_g1_i1.p1 TRINITY_DN72719_c0_g1~~TRINITY_DN72719_c0_g1_i1.p1  ORF type:complete len:548 (-),score=133.09 TRINITY_DN72719_c0_g1_i1:40-1683(-)